jgi:hypothetical protein
VNQTEVLPVLFWLCWVEVIRVHGHFKARLFFKMFIDDRQGQIIIAVVVEGNRSVPQE